MIILCECAKNMQFAAKTDNFFSNCILLGRLLEQGECIWKNSWG
jgi:hypothetical protein